MLLFVDESGQDHKGMPCEVLAGVAVAESNYWNLIRAIRFAEQSHFGDYLRNLRCTEVKARKLLSREIFRNAQQDIVISDTDISELANSFLKKGMEDKKLKRSESSCNRKEFVGYARSVLNFINNVLDIAANHNVKIFASVVDANAAKFATEHILQRDFTYLFERYFYYLNEDERGLVVFDELEKSKAQKLIQQMASYFLGTDTGKFRSSRIIPEPFFVHSELTTGIFLADMAAYIIGWSWRLKTMPQQYREELKPYARKLDLMQYEGEKPKLNGDGVWKLRGITYIDSAKGKTDKGEDISI